MGSLLDTVRQKLFGEPVLQPTDVTTGMRGAGTAFASLIENVGKAVAKSQEELDTTSGHIASIMAQTQIDTVQAVVTEYDDNTGDIKDVSIVPGQTSALVIAVPPALSFKRVHLEGSFVASEFSAAQHSNVNVTLISAKVSGRGLRGISASGSITNVNTDNQTDQTVDQSVANMSMTALIRPKPVTAVPKPPLVVKGPTLSLGVVNYLPDSRPDNPSTNPSLSDPPALYRRSVVIFVQLTLPSGMNGSAAAKTIAIDSGGLDMAITDSAGTPSTTGPITDAAHGNGFWITVSRTVPDQSDPKKNFVIRASLNLISAVLSIDL